MSGNSKGSFSTRDSDHGVYRHPGWADCPAPPWANPSLFWPVYSLEPACVRQAASGGLGVRFAGVFV